MKILILVQATKIEPWNSLIEAQKVTWDSINEEGVDTLYYYSDDKQHLDGKDLFLKCPQEADMNNYRFKLALDYLYDSNDPGYDYIFRTNASSYIDKKLLKEWLKDKPRSGFYCGINGGGFASGCGFALSTDLVNILRTIDDYPTASEDCLIGVYLERTGIKVSEGAQRFDYYFSSEPLPKIYHYRCKSDTEDRSKDIAAFNHLFNFLNA